MSPSAIVPILLPCIAGLFGILLLARGVLCVRGHKAPARDQRTRSAAQVPVADREQLCADYRQQLIAAGIVHPAPDLAATSGEIASPTG